jgi:hypothetical protein
MAKQYMLEAFVRSGDDLAAAMEKALVEHVARHPEAARYKVQDFDWEIFNLDCIGSSPFRISAVETLR